METNIGLFLLYLGLICCPGVMCNNALEIKKGSFPYMAFIYYLDPSILDEEGGRLVRSAVLVKPDWLVTSSNILNTIDTPNGFPQKTLLARAGAITMDSNFTLNEDEDEQEREIIQVVRPYNYSESEWWTKDIVLMKTLVPFNVTLAVDSKPFNAKNTVEKNCFILVYSRKGGNFTDEKTLMQLFVEILQPTVEECGQHLSPTTMICATTANENNDTSYDENFCSGNSGGPLVCEGELVGIQTYIENNCSTPHIYQLLSSWDKFLNCGVEDKCISEECHNTCDITFKDSPKETATLMEVNLEIENTEETATDTETMTTTFASETETDTSISEEISTVTSTDTSTETTTVTSTTLGDANVTETETTSWPKKKEEPAVTEREDINVEVKHQRAEDPRPKRVSSDAPRLVAVGQNFIFAYLSLMYLN